MQTPTVLFQGAPRSGKSQLISWHMTQRPRSSYVETLEDEYKCVWDCRGQKVSANFLDTGGMADYAEMLEEWVGKATAQILLLNLEDPSSVAYLRSNLAVLQSAKVLARVLVGNLPSGDEKKRAVSKQDALKLAETFGDRVPYVEISTLTGAGVSNVFTTLIECLTTPAGGQRSGAEPVKDKHAQELADKDAEIRALKERQITLEARVEAQERKLEEFIAKFAAMDATLNHRIESMVEKAIRITKTEVEPAKAGEMQTPTKAPEVAAVHVQRGAAVKQGLFTTP